MDAGWVYQMCVCSSSLPGMTMANRCRFIQACRLIPLPTPSRAGAQSKEGVEEKILQITSKDSKRALIKTIAPYDYIPFFAFYLFPLPPSGSPLPLPSPPPPQPCKQPCHHLLIHPQYNLPTDSPSPLSHLHVRFGWDLSSCERARGGEGADENCGRGSAVYVCWWSL